MSYDTSSPDEAAKSAPTAVSAEPVRVAIEPPAAPPFSASKTESDTGEHGKFCRHWALEQRSGPGGRTTSAQKMRRKPHAHHPRRRLLQRLSARSSGSSSPDEYERLQSRSSRPDTLLTWMNSGTHTDLSILILHARPGVRRWSRS
jgi:hypothetical protein